MPTVHLSLVVASLCLFAGTDVSVFLLALLTVLILAGLVGELRGHFAASQVAMLEVAERKCVGTVVLVRDGGQGTSVNTGHGGICWVCVTVPQSTRP